MSAYQATAKIVGACRVPLQRPSPRSLSCLVGAAACCLSHEFMTHPMRCLSLSCVTRFNTAWEPVYLLLHTTCVMGALTGQWG
jgi:hypothetical protein